MYSVQLHCKKRLATFPSPAGMSLTKLSLGGNRAGMSLTFFLQCIEEKEYASLNDNTDICDVGLICKVGLYSRQHLLLPRACSILRLRPSTSLRQCFAHRALAEGVSSFSEDRKSATSLIGSRNHRFVTIYPKRTRYGVLLY